MSERDGEGGVGGGESNEGKKKKEDRWFYEAGFKRKSSEERQKIRSKTFPGIARAMAEQWIAFI